MSSAGQFRRSLIYMIPMVIGVLFPLLTLPIFTRILTTADYGVIAMGTAYGLFASGIANLGLPLTYERNFFQYTERGASARLLYSIVLFVSVLLVVGGIGTWAFREELSNALTGSPRNGALLFVSYCAFGLQSIKLYFLTYFKNEGDAKAFAWYSVDETLLWTALALFFIAFLRLGAIGLPLGQLVGGSIIVSLLFFRFLRRLKPAIDGSMLWEAVRMSLPLTPRLFITVVSNNFDKYIVGVLGSMGGVGLYSIGQKIALLVFGSMTALQNVFAPGVYRRMFAGGEAASGIGRYLTPFAYASVTIAMVVALFAEEVLFVLTPPEFHGAAVVVNVLAMYYAVLFFGKQPQLVYAKKAALLSLLSGVTMALYVGANILFVRAWGVVGAAWGTLVAGLVSTAIGVVAGQRYYRIDYEWRRLIAIYALFGFAATTAFVLGTLEVAYVARLFFKLVAVLGILALGRRLGFVDGRLIQHWRADLWKDHGRSDTPVSASDTDEAAVGKPLSEAVVRL